jgi:SAM-dependent methyltransferase
MPFLDYDAFAGAYAEQSRTNAYNARFERPAIRALVPPVDGRDVLDAGCAAGEQTAWLVSRGARVTALDVSERMIALARAALGDDAICVQADLDRPLPFANAAFDLVFSSLALHYTSDLTATLAEFARVLRRPGVLVFSTHHPMLDVDGGDYYATRVVDDRWNGFGAEPVRVRWYHRSLETLVRSLCAAGFAIDDLAEPLPDPQLARTDARAYADLRRRPPFLFVRATTR